MHAAWVDDWLASKTETSPGYFSGQQRGYYTGGGFSARWNGGGAVFPITVQPPKIKAGCGGIDAFMGGFSFMNADMLVQKLQAVLANAPAVAFDLALNTLCTPCAQAIKWMEDLSDKLNSIQLDACKLSQITVAKAFDAAGADNAQVKGLAERSYAMETGISNFYHKSQKDQESHGNAQATSDTTMLAGCPADIRDIFTNLGASGDGSVIQNAGAKLGFDSSYLNLARGIFGDVLIFTRNTSAGATTLNYAELAMCPGNSGDAAELINSIANNTAQSRPAGAAGACVSAASGGLQSTVQTTLQSIADKMRTKTGTLTLPETAMLQRVPLPISLILKSSIATGQETSTISVMTEAVTKAYAYAAIRDLVDVLARTAHLAEDIKAKGGIVGPACQIDILINAFELLKPIRERIHATLQPLYNAQQRTLSDIDTTLRVASRYESFEKKSKNELGTLFLPALVNKGVSQ